MLGEINLVRQQGELLRPNQDDLSGSPGFAAHHPIVATMIDLRG